MEKQKGHPAPAPVPTESAVSKRPTPTPDEEKWLQANRENEREGIDQFDKTILTLTGGAFTVSLVFIKDIVQPANVHVVLLLILAWFSWLLAMSGTLISFYASHRAAREVVTLFGEGKTPAEAIKLSRWSKITIWLNPRSGVCFVVGLACMLTFAIVNLVSAPHGNTQTSATASTQTNIVVIVAQTNSNSASQTDKTNLPLQSVATNTNIGTTKSKP